MNTTLVLAIALAAVIAASSLLYTRIRAESRSRVLSEYITNNMPSGLVMVDSRGYITGHNPASQRIFGYAMGTGKRFADLVVEASEFHTLLDRCLTTAETFTRKEFNVGGGAAAVKRIGVNLSPITNARGQTDGVGRLLALDGSKRNRSPSFVTFCNLGSGSRLSNIPCFQVVMAW